jgi:proteasome accessory factor B
LNSNLRNVQVYSYFSLNGFWYFSGFDTEKMDIRTFRCDRVQGELKVPKKLNSYQIPADYKTDMSFNDLTPDKKAILRIRKGRGAQIKMLASSLIDDGDFDTVQINYSSQIPLVQLILWHLDDVEVLEPMFLRDEIVKSLENLVHNHG